MDNMDSAEKYHAHIELGGILNCLGGILNCLDLKQAVSLEKELIHCVNSRGTVISAETKILESFGGEKQVIDFSWQSCHIPAAGDIKPKIFAAAALHLKQLAAKTMPLFSFPGEVEKHISVEIFTEENT